MEINLTNNSDLIIEKDKKDVGLANLTERLAKGHEYVEIGGVKWATMNVGATGVTDEGMYFQWGDTEGYIRSQVGVDKTFDSSNYKFLPRGFGGAPDYGMSKYKTTDRYKNLTAEDDAVTANWGGAWRLPTSDEFVALSGTTYTEWTNNYKGTKKKGLIVTDRKDETKELFFPAASKAQNSSVYDIGTLCYYLSSTVYPTFVADACVLYFDNNGGYNWVSQSYRFHGYVVRGVLDV